MVEPSDSDEDSDGNLRGFVVNSSSEDNDDVSNTSESEGEFVDDDPRQGYRRLKRFARESSDDNSDNDDDAQERCEYNQQMVLYKLKQRRDEYKVISLKSDPLIQEYCDTLPNGIGDYLVVRKPTAMCTIAKCNNLQCVKSDGRYGPSYEKHYVPRMIELTNCECYCGSNYEYCLAGFDSEFDYPMIWCLNDNLNEVRCICDYSSRPPNGLMPLKEIAVVLHLKSRISFVTGSSCWHHSADASRKIEATQIGNTALGNRDSLLFGKENAEMVEYIFNQPGMFDDDTDDEEPKRKRRRRVVLEED